MGLIIHAPNVHRGGGKSLLVSLLKALKNETGCKVIFDARLHLPDEMPSSFSEIRINPSIVGRIAAEWRLSILASENDTVLCFGNLPPLFKTKGRILLFLHNRYLIGRPDLAGFPLLKKMQIRLERIWLNFRLEDVKTIIVQTPSMQREVLKATGIKATVLPFAEQVPQYENLGHNPIPDRTPGYDFVYVASGDPHKNHINLIEAWKLLAKEGIFPSLCLTVSKDSFPELCSRIEGEKKQHSLKIKNLTVPPEEIHELYAKAGALIYPSTMESLGLPLVEAKSAGLPVIASELDYVRDVVKPDECFDPQSPTSIARAVKRFLGKNEEPAHLMSAEAFVDHLLNTFN